MTNPDVVVFSTAIYLVTSVIFYYWMGRGSRCWAQNPVVAHRAAVGAYGLTRSPLLAHGALFFALLASRREQRIRKGRDQNGDDNADDRGWSDHCTPSKPNGGEGTTSVFKATQQS